MDLDRLNAFVQVARERSFSRAALRLGRTQPAVSQVIRALEDDLGERLFDRSGRRVRLTQAGEVLFEHASRAFSELDAGFTALAGLRELTSGVVSIGTSDTNACHLLPPVLELYRERYPAVEVRISNRPSPETVRQVLAGEVDLGLVTLPTGESRLVAEPVTQREDVLICAASHPLARRRRVRLSELAGLPLLLLDRGSRTRAFIDEALVAAGVHAQVAMELASIDLIRRLVALDFGISIVPEIAVADEVASGRIAAIRVFGRTELRTLGLVYPTRVRLSPAAEAFRELVHESLGQ
ncbi:MAG: LysR family transcriptional regulator [bacterium]|nr:LysR family transcriptional regulator [bacterium]